MGYSQWKDFKKIIEKVREILIEELGEVADQPLVSETRNQVRRGLRGTQEQEDFHLTRFAAYKLALECDGSKPEVRAAKTYFAAKTREAELAPAQVAELTSPSDLDVLQTVVNALPAMVTELRRQREDIDSQRKVTVDHEVRITALEQAPSQTLALDAPPEVTEFTARGYARLHGYPTDKNSITRLGAKASRLMKKYAGESPNFRPDPEYGKVNIYPLPWLDFAAVMLWKPEVDEEQMASHTRARMNSEE